MLNVCSKERWCQYALSPAHWEKFGRHPEGQRVSQTRRFAFGRQQNVSTTLDLVDIQHSVKWNIYPWLVVASWARMHLRSQLESYLSLFSHFNTIFFPVVTIFRSSLPIQLCLAWRIMHYAYVIMICFQKTFFNRLRLEQNKSVYSLIKTWHN